MKRFLVLVSLCFPLSVSAANKMSMVTYFPVPYVAYSRINVSDQLDAGLTSACNMNLGCNESSVNLQVNTLNVKQYSKLDLNGGKGVLSNSMTLGSGSDNGRIVFNKVRIQGGTSRSINVKGTMNVPSLKLFESDFPDCKQAGGKDGTMSWTPLKLKGAAGSELYLACGEAGAGTCQPTDPRGARYTEDCPSGQTGTIIYTWNNSLCRYDTSGSCKEDIREINVYCMTHYCYMGYQEFEDGIDHSYTNFMGCKLSSNSPVNVTIYRKPLKSHTSWPYYEKWDILSPGGQVIDGCGWGNYSYDNYYTCTYNFGLDESGAKSITQVVNGTSYKIVLEQDSVDEDNVDDDNNTINNPYCALSPFLW